MASLMALPAAVEALLRPLYHHEDPRLGLGDGYCRFIDDSIEGIYADVVASFPEVTPYDVRQLVHSLVSSWSLGTGNADGQPEGVPPAPLNESTPSPRSTGDGGDILDSFEGAVCVLDSADLKRSAIVSFLREELRRYRKSGGGQYDQAESAQVVDRIVAGARAAVSAFLPEVRIDDYYSQDDFKELLGFLINGPLSVDDAQSPRLAPSSHVDFGWKVFDNLLQVARTYGYTRNKEDKKPYKDFIPKHGHDELFRLLKKSVCPVVWSTLVDGGKPFTPELLRSSGLPHGCGDHPFPGWYLIVLEDPKDPSWWRVYVGQSTDLKRREKSHLTNSKNSNVKELLYHTWRAGLPVPKDQPLPREAKIYPLGWDNSGLTGKDRELFLNLGEMFFCLVLQTLQEQSLLRWLPKDVRLLDDLRGLNVSVPISEMRHGSFYTIWDSKDPDVLAYARSVVKTNLGAAQVALKEMGYTPIAMASRARSSKFVDGIYRSADPAKGDLESVEVRCKCG